MSLERVLRRHRTIRSVGIDDAPFERGGPEPVSIAGVVCADTTFEGMVWGDVTPDGWDATDVICELLVGGKFLPQLHLVLLDGIALGGFNVVDLPQLHARLGVPCVAVMRDHPDFAAVEAAIHKLPEADRRLAVLRRAGTIHEADDVFFQAEGAQPDTVRRALRRVTCTGHIPEPIRLAHLIGAAVKTGESGRRA